MGIKRRQPSDYPTFTFRLSGEDKAVLMKRVRTTRDTLNKNVKEGERIWLKNQVIVEAMNLGLNILNKRKAN